MNIVNRLTLRHLKENKGRTVVTTMGIIVSVAMITAVFVAFASFLNLFGEIELISSGNYVARYTVSASQLEAIKNDDRISEVGIGAIEDKSFRLSSRKSDSSGTGDILSGDRVHISQMVTGEYDGTLPQHKNEIAVSQRLIDRNRLDWKIGDNVSIPTGIRYTVEDGEEMLIAGSYQGGESFRQKEIGEYKITAILKSTPATPFTSILLCDIKDISPDDNALYDAYASLSRANSKSIDEIKAVAKQYGIEKFSYNSDFLETRLAVDKDSSGVVATMFGAVIVILVIIMIASVVLIYNAFAMSISERVRYLGMLASVGATKKQKRASVYFESLILGVVGIPVGMLSGIIGIFITLKAIGARIISSGLIQGITTDTLEMKVVIPPLAIAGIIIFSVLTIFVSSFIPASKASAITPIDALRQTSEIRLKSRRLRSSRLVRLVFGYEGELANKNMKRNGGKSRIITASIALSMVLFISCNYFCTMFTSQVDLESEMPYQLTASVEYKNKDSLRKALGELSDINDFYCVSNFYTFINDSAVDSFDFFSQKHLNSANKALFKNGYSVTCNAIDDERFNELCRRNGISSDEYYKGDCKALLMNNVSHKSSRDRVFEDSIIGSNIGELFEQDITVGNIIDYDRDDKLFSLNPRNTISAFAPISRIENITMYYAGIEADNPSEVEDEIYELLSDGDYEVYYVNNLEESLQAMKSISFVLQVLVYGFIALMSLITVFNIINTISTSVALRRKEFAMLRSVGTTPRGFNKMIMLESAFYGLKAVIVATPLCIAASYIMYAALNTNYVSFRIDWRLYLSVIAVILFVIGLTMIYSVRKYKDDNIVETLKLDIT